MLRGDHHVHLQIHQIRSNRERGRVAWMYGNYYCVHAIFVEKIDGIQKKSVSLEMGVIRINRKSDKVEGSEDMGHLHFPIMTKPRHSAKRKGTGTSFVHVRFRLIVRPFTEKVCDCFHKTCRNVFFTFSDLRLVVMNFSLSGGTKIDQFTRAAHLPGRKRKIIEIITT
jgi:hypothetical protein